MVVYPEGVWYRYETQTDVEEILRSHIIGGKKVERLALTINPATIHG
jgi:(2Fe-2S) ferredoxin